MVSAPPLLWQLFLVLLVAVAAYARTLPYALVWDDLVIAGQVSDVMRERGLMGLLRARFGLEHLGYYRPVVLLSFQFDTLLARFLPAAHHLTNVLLHALNAALVTLLARAVLGAGWGALFAGLLFALHPVHVESVAFVSGRTDLWAAFFLLLSALFWMHERAELGQAHGRALRAAGGTTFLLALLSKEVAFLLPAVLLCWDVAGAGAAGAARGGWHERNRRWIIVWALALAAALALRFWGAGFVFGVGAAGTRAADGGANHALDPRIWLTYLRLLLIPWPLSAYYSPEDLRWTGSGLAAAVGVVGVFLAAARRSAAKAGVLGAAWFGGFLLPVSGVVPLAGAIVAERFLYLPSVGFCLAAGGLVAGSRRLRPVAVGAGFLLLVAASAGTVLRGAIWRDNFTLFQEMVRASPSSALAHANLGNAWQERQQPGNALEEYAAAVRIDPGNGAAHQGWGGALMKLGRTEEAVAHFKAAANLLEDDYEPHYNLGLAYLTLNRPEEAVRENLLALKLRPSYALASNNLGVAYSTLGRHEDAAAAFRSSLQADPACAGCSYNLGLEFAALGRWSQAAAAFEEARRLGLENSAVRAALNRARAMAGRGAQP